MNIVFRADANHNIGMGHVMRCLSIADACNSAGHNVKFVIADHEVETLIRARGYEFAVLSSDYARMDYELSLWPQLESPDAIFVDSYHVTPSYLLNMKQMFNSMVVYIDDMPAFPYPVDVLVNYNLYAPEIAYNTIYADTGIQLPQLVLGASYAPLRDIFKGVEKRIQKEHVENVLLSTGGADEFHLALAFSKAILGLASHRYTYHILIGALNQDREAIRSIASKNEFIVLHENVSDMRSLIQNMDLVVSAAGSTLYEICACGVPLITYVLADNQIPGAKAFGKLGLAMNIGDIRDFSPRDQIAAGKMRGDATDMIRNALERISDNYSLRVEMGERMQKTIDGFGADRIFDAIAKNIKIGKGARHSQGGETLEVHRGEVDVAVGAGGGRSRPS